MPVARCRIDLYADSRLPRRRHRIAEQRSQRPRANRFSADMARLIHRLHIVISRRDFPRISKIENIAVLVALSIEILRSRVCVERIVSGEIARSDALTLETHAAKGQMPVRRVVECADVAVLDWPCRVSNEAPLFIFVVCP